MTAIKITTLEENYYNADNNKLIVTIFRKSLLDDLFMRFWRVGDFFERIVELDIGQSYTHYFSAEHTSKLKLKPTLKIPQLAVVGQQKKPCSGQIIAAFPPCKEIAVIKKVFNAWLEVEPFANLISGRNINLKSTILDSKLVSISEAETLNGQVSLKPFNTTTPLSL